MELREMALIAWQSGRHDEAKAILEQVLTQPPVKVRDLHFYGVVLTQTGDYEEAIRQLQIACEAEPGNQEAWSDLANVQHMAGKMSDAESTLRSGIELSPEDPNLWFNLGILLNGMKRAREAEAAFLRVTELDQADQAAWIELGRLRYARSAHLDAARAFLQAAALDGEGQANALRFAGFAFADAGRPQDSERLLASLCPGRPQDTEDFHLLSQLLFCRLELCDWRQIPEMVDRCKQFIGEGRTPLEPFTFLLLPEITAEEQLALTGDFAESLLPHPAVQMPASVNPDPARRLRIAYLSADFHDHAVMRLLIGVLEHHEHAEFEIHAFSYGSDDQGVMRRRIVAACDSFHDVRGCSPEILAGRIRDESIDILVDLAGWTGNTRTAALGYRPAPIQVNWLGYSGTLGSRVLVDYLIGDPISTPLADQQNFAEELVLMPNCCHPNDSSRPIGKTRTRQEEGLPENGFVFCCFSRPLKITPEIFYCWCDLLSELPGSVLWLYAANDLAKINLVAEASRRGIADSRLIFAAARPPELHLARLALADLALDTFPFGAHTTTSDALWAGLPVLTMMGETFASRVSGSMLNAVGLGELAVGSIEEYRAKALDLASNTRRLLSIRDKLRMNRLSSPLFDTQRFSGELESRYRAMWQRHCRTLEATT